MAIRFTDVGAIRAQLVSRLDDVGSALAGTNTAPPARTGIISSQLGSVQSSLQGLFAPAASVSGTITSLLGNVSGLITGSFTAAATGGPLILYTDTISGPASGGENNLGTYLNIFGIFPGAFLNSDGTTNVSVTIGGVAVANFRCVVPAVVSGKGYGPAGKGLNAITRIGVQIGNLTGLAQNGTYFPVVVKVGGVSPSNTIDGSGFYLTLDGDRIHYCPNPGPIVFVDGVNGNDTNAGTISSPLKNLQIFDGNTTFTGALFGTTHPTQTNVVQPGTQIVVRAAGTYTTTSFENRWGNLFRMTGTAPNGATPAAPIVVNGVSCRASGYIGIIAYPGPINGNAPERPYNQSSKGGFNLAHTAQGGETTIWGTTGWAQYMQFSGLKIDVAATGDSDSAPINLQTNAKFYRIVDCQLGPWPSNIEALAGGVSGYGAFGCMYGNYIPGITSSTGQENHGRYVGNNPNGTGLLADALGEYRSRIAYNLVVGTTGNGVFARGSCFAETAADAISIHHNWFDMSSGGKHGINLSDSNANSTPVSGRSGGRQQANCWDNVIIKGQAGCFTNNDTGATAIFNGIVFVNNTIYGWNTYGAFYFPDGIGSKLIENNVVLQAAGQASTLSGFVNGSGAIAYKNNIYFDPTGANTSLPTGDSTSLLTDPKLVSPSTGDFTPGAGSPAVNFGVTPDVTGLVTKDFNFLSRPQGSNSKVAAGAFERAGG